MKLYYNPKLKPLARQLRNNATLSEVLLWNELKGRKMIGYPFKRQKPIGNYIVDFYCSTLKLVIEIDGESHRFKFPKDLDRQEWLQELGITVLRFDDLEVKQDMENVLYSIVVNPVRLWKPDRVIIEANITPVPTVVALVQKDGVQLEAVLHLGRK